MGKLVMTLAAVAAVGCAEAFEIRVNDGPSVLAARDTIREARASGKIAAGRLRGVRDSDILLA